ncbi:MAG: hypothetical protein BMS9Abin37_1436 [Acidobacteriota bacterium]|nr:MAG: hypothetical protein BMS9Abin37_1436 [Acidobacteriota bacterium]
MVTTVRLPENLYEALRRRAFEERRPVAEIIREAIGRFLDEPIVRSPLPDLESDPFWKVVGTVDGGPSDESIEHDHYLYGAQKKARQE